MFLCNNRRNLPSLHLPELVRQSQYCHGALNQAVQHKGVYIPQYKNFQLQQSLPEGSKDAPHILAQITYQGV